MGGGVFFFSFFLFFSLFLFLSLFLFSFLYVTKKWRERPRGGETVRFSHQHLFYENRSRSSDFWIENAIYNDCIGPLSLFPLPTFAHTS